MARIAIGIEDVHRRGGQERVVWEMIQRWQDRHQLDLICYCAEDIDEGKVRVIRLPERVRFSGFLRALWFRHAASRQARRGEHDVVLSMGSNMSSQNFVFAHTCHAERIVRRRENEWRRYPPSPAKRAEYAVRDWLMYRYERREMLRCRGRIIAVEHLLKADLMKHYGLRDEEILLAENGVDPAYFTPDLRDEWRSKLRRELNIPEETFVILFVGGLWDEKGLSYIIRALPRMRYVNTRLVVVGSGDEEEFGRRAADLGVRDRVLFAGRTPHPERFYAMADCFAFLTQAEGLALVQLEAAASGLPLLLTEGHCPPGLVENGENGFMVPPDEKALAPKLDLLAADPDFRCRAGEASRKRAMSFTWDEQARKIDAFFEQHLRSAPA